MSHFLVGLASLLLAGATQPVPLRWQLLKLPYPAVYSVAPAQDDSGIVYATAADPDTGQSGAFRSDDAGATWSLLVDALPGDTATSIGVDPRDSGRVFAAAVHDLNGLNRTTRLYASGDRGSTWRFIGEYSDACGAEIAFDPSNSNRVYVNLGCGFGLLTSGDAGETFQRHDMTLFFLRVSPTGLLYAVGDDGVIRSTNGEHWTNVASFTCSDQGASVIALAVDSEGRLLLSTGCRRMIFIYNTGVFDSTDGGADWRQLSDLGIMNPVFDPSRSSNVYASALSLVGAVTVLGSDDGGRTWQDLGLPAYIRQLAVSRSGRFLYAATGSGVYRLDTTETRVVPPEPRLVSPR